MTPSPRNRRKRFGRIAAVVAVAAVALATARAASAQIRAAAPESLRGCAPATPGHPTCTLLRRSGIHAPGRALAAPSSAGLTPADLALAYQFDTTGGAGRTVAIVDAYDDPNAESDLAVYRSQFGLPACTTANGCFRKVNQNGAATPLPSPAISNWGAEISLDLDMVSAVCPNCHILLVEADAADAASLYAAVDTAAANASFVSNSWGGNEYADEVNQDFHFNHPGTVITFSTGDDGNGGGVQYPAASPYVVAVGGTSLTRGTGGFTERAWSGAGSGCSAFEPQPGWQVGPPDTHCAKRAIADVAADADPFTGASVYDTYDDTGWDVFGGTSQASPIIAAGYALAGAPASSDPAPFLLYRHFIGRGPTVVPPEHVLTDVTTGNNGDCGAPSCDARTGWDGPTGVGTPIGTGAFVRPFAFGAIVTDNQATPVQSATSLTVRGRDGTLPYTWAATGLPPGLSIAAASGVISGTPTTPGGFTVTVTGHDATTSPAGSYTFGWVINPPTQATVPNVIDDGPNQAFSAIAAAGLVVGSQGQVVDCNHIKAVASQSPAPGTQVAPGSSVNLLFGIPPKKTGCP
ncbi:putative Ig domain-containing protein [Actinocrispum wychmicini]|uniref:Subtilase family protein n=1 Tax=Actinocrispum wychmicini TaxID=1213861 RepID=A0A4R2J993_9PSEU|nr:putative Ig domain-containing protein [Actinocrispum wychmicini]TCO55881.1 subtilase family protein [Actinocrispum wychmicini]